MNEYRLFTEEVVHVNRFRPPCKSIEKLIQTIHEIDLGMKCTFVGGDHNKLVVRANVFREAMYKKVTFTRAYSLQSLVGNAGM